MVKSNLLAEFAVSKDRLIQALACVSNLADRAVVQAIVHPKDTILGFAFSNTLVNGESGEQIYAYYVTTPAPLKGQASTVLIPTDCSPNLSILIAAFQSQSTESPNEGIYGRDQKASFQPECHTWNTS